MKDKRFDINTRYSASNGCALRILSLGNEQQFPDALDPFPTLIKTGEHYYIYGCQDNGQWKFTKLELDDSEHQLVDDLGIDFNANSRSPIGPDPRYEEIYKSMLLSRAHYFGTTLLHVADRAGCTNFTKVLVNDCGAHEWISDENGHTLSHGCMNESRHPTACGASSIDDDSITSLSTQLMESFKALGQELTQNLKKEKTFIFFTPKLNDELARGLRESLAFSGHIMESKVIKGLQKGKAKQILDQFIHNNVKILNQCGFIPNSVEAFLQSLNSKNSELCSGLEKPNH